jgi:hypothetical protein
MGTMHEGRQIQHPVDGRAVLGVKVWRSSGGSGQPTWIRDNNIASATEEPSKSTVASTMARADTIRSAPGVPIATIAPSSCIATEGAMLEVIRFPARRSYSPSRSGAAAGAPRNPSPGTTAPPSTVSVAGFLPLAANITGQPLHLSEILRADFVQVLAQVLKLNQANRPFKQLLKAA